MRQNVTIPASGVQGNSVAVNTAVATITNPGPGRYRIWGTARHSLVDGIKVTVGAGTPLILSGGAGDTIQFGPLVVDILNSTTSIVAALNTATGASDTASCTMYAELINH